METSHSNLRMSKAQSDGPNGARETPSAGWSTLARWFLAIILPGLILTVACSWVIESGIFGTQGPHKQSIILEWSCENAKPGIAKVRVQEGNAEIIKAEKVVPDETGLATVRVALPRNGRYRSLELSLLDKPSEIRFRGARLTNIERTWVREIPLGEFKEVISGRPLESDGSIARSDLGNPSIVANFESPIEIAEAGNVFRPGFIKRVMLLFVTFILLLHTLRLEKLIAARRSLVESCVLNPRKAVFGAAVLGVVASCFPIAFCGMSWVSASSGVPLLYDKLPTVPMSDEDAAVVAEEPMGSDVGATMWCHYPMVFQAHRAVFRDGEMPLWNRYSWCGISQVGQFFHMWGDPLHWLPIATGGASWAWDLKGLLTRLIYAFGAGLLVFRAVGSLRVAMILAISACFHGFFILRTAHVAQFAFAYMPWVLLAWIEASKAETARRCAKWSALLIIASWQGLNGGTAKEAAISISLLNVLGMSIIIAGSESWRLRIAKMGWMLWGNILLLLLSAPLWMPFMKSLREGVSLYQAVRVYQLQPGLLVGLFDEIFQRQVVPNEKVLSAGANFLILLGTLWSVVSARSLRKSPIFVGCCLCVIIGCAVVFGAIPASLLAKIPIIQSISHFDITFSFMLFTPLLVVAGFGLKEMWESFADPEWCWKYTAIIIIFLSIIGLFVGYTESAHRHGLSVHNAGSQYYKSNFFLGYAVCISISLIVLPALVRVLRRGSAAAPTSAVLIMVSMVTMHYRMGMHLETSFDMYAYNPKAGYDYGNLQSSGVEYLKNATAIEPARVTGLNGTLFPGFSITPGLENICGAEAFETKTTNELFGALGLKRNNWGWRIEIDSKSYPLMQRALDFIGVRYLAADRGVQIPFSETLVPVHGGDMIIAESKGAWPRAFFTSRATGVNNVNEVASLLRQGDGRPFAAVGMDVLEAHPSLGGEGSGTMSRAYNYRLTNNSTSFSVNADSPGLAVLHETNPGSDMIAKVNGIEVPCLLVNGAFRAAWLPSGGTNRIEFIYSPKVWRNSLTVGGAGFVLSIGTMLLIARNRRVPKRISTSENGPHIGQEMC